MKRTIKKKIYILLFIYLDFSCIHQNIKIASNSYNQKTSNIKLMEESLDR